MFQINGFVQARIKRIMQLDDDIGRVASSVPIVICILLLAMVNYIAVTTKAFIEELGICYVVLLM